jgi:hypothetical protein
MAETGWPLIPREALPAPVRRARPRALPDAAAGHAEGDRHPDSGRQLSIFGADTIEPSPADLAGLLAGPGRLDRMGGTARVSVPVDAAWRVHVLVNELVSRGLVVSWQPISTPGSTASDPSSGTAHQPHTSSIGPDRHRGDAHRPDGSGSAPDRGDDADPDDYDVEPIDVDPDPDYDADLIDEPAGDVEAGDSGAGPGGPVAGRSAAGAALDRDDETGADGGSGTIGTRGAVATAVFDVRTAYSSRLNGLARSWPAAAGRLFLSGPRLRLWVAAAGGPVEDGYALGLDPDDDPSVVDAALVRAGLAGTLSDDGRYYLIMGKRRLARLAELVGERPAEAPPALWPGGVAA